MFVQPATGVAAAVGVARPTVRRTSPTPTTSDARAMAVAGGLIEWLRWATDSSPQDRRVGPTPTVSAFGTDEAVIKVFLQVLNDIHGVNTWLDVGDPYPLANPLGLRWRPRRPTQ